MSKATNSTSSIQILLTNWKLLLTHWRRIPVLMSMVAHACSGKAQQHPLRYKYHCFQNGMLVGSGLSLAHTGGSSLSLTGLLMSVVCFQARSLKFCVFVLRGHISAGYMLGRHMRTVHSESSTRNGSTATRRVSSAPLRGASCICISISKDSATGVDFKASFCVC